MVFEWITYLFGGRKGQESHETNINADFVVCKSSIEWSEIIISHEKPSEGKEKGNKQLNECQSKKTQTNIPTYFTTLQQTQKTKKKTQQNKGSNQEMTYDQQNLFLYFNRSENFNSESLLSEGTEEQQPIAASFSASQKRQQRRKKSKSKRKAAGILEEMRKMTTIHLLEMEWDHYPVEYIGMAFENRPRSSMFKYFEPTC